MNKPPADLGSVEIPMLESMPLRNDDPHMKMVQILNTIFGRDFAWDDSVERTAARFVEFLREFVPLDEPDFNFTMFEPAEQQMVVVSGIRFSSICLHHLLPFYGVAHVGYLPHTKMVGLSKIPRLVEYFSRRPQTQERLGAQIAKFMMDKHGLAPKGVMVVLEAEHTCMSCRGIRAVSARMVTSELRGVFLTANAARQEFLQLIRRQHE